MCAICSGRGSGSFATPIEANMTDSKTSRHFHCPGCGNRVVQITGQLNPRCTMCGVLLVEREAARKPGKLGPVLLFLSLALLGAVLGKLIYLAVK